MLIRKILVLTLIFVFNLKDFNFVSNVYASPDSGYNDGAREGNERGPADGDRMGREDGVRKGRHDGEEAGKRRDYERGYNEGYRVGTSEGDYKGRVDGDNNGRTEGERNGRNDGLTRSDKDAYDAATPLGRAKGIEEANASDATDRGMRDGTIAGDEFALSEAIRVDYAEGRKDYYDQRYAEPVENNDSFSQISKNRSLIPNLLKNIEILQNITSNLRDSRTSPDYRYSNPGCNLPTPQDNQNCEKNYRNAYNNGFSQAYNSSYRAAYDRVFRQIYDNAYSQAFNTFYQWDHQRGYDEGRQRGYNEAYRRAYDIAYNNAYNWIYPQAYKTAYENNYPIAYARHYENARQAAYAARVKELYDAAFAYAKKKKYDEMYPKYADIQYKKGVTDETEDFRVRPVRLLDAEPTETIVNGLFEPGELLRVKVNLRNFASEVLDGKNIEVRIEALDNTLASIAVASSNLKQNLKRKSITSVSDLLEFRLNESSADRLQQLKVTVFYNGLNVGEKVINLMAQYMIQTTLAEKPSFYEGIESPLRVKVKNISKVATDKNYKLVLKSDPETIALVKSEELVGVLNSGEERVVEFRVIAKKPGISGMLAVPLVVDSSSGDGRRIGLLEMSSQVPIINDYKILFKGDPTILRKAGVARLDYTITNVNSRLLLKSLQVYVKFIDAVDGAYHVIGPNPQYLSPVLKGETVDFVIPVIVKDNNEGGTIQLTVEEDGRTVVIHEVKY